MSPSGLNETVGLNYKPAFLFRLLILISRQLKCLPPPGSHTWWCAQDEGEQPQTLTPDNKTPGKQKKKRIKDCQDTIMRSAVTLHVWSNGREFVASPLSESYYTYAGSLGVWNTRGVTYNAKHLWPASEAHTLDSFIGARRKTMLYFIHQALKQ